MGSDVSCAELGAMYYLFPSELTLFKCPSQELDIALSRDAKILDLRSYSSAAKSARRDEGVETPYFQSHTALRCTLREQRARDIQRQNEAINAQKSQSLITSRFSGSFAFPTSPVARNFKDSSQPESPSNPTIDPPKEEKPRETITADELDSIRNKAKSMEEHLQYMTRACAYFLDPNEKHSADDKTLFSKYESWFSFSFGTGFTGMCPFLPPHCVVVPKQLYSFVHTFTTLLISFLFQE